MTRRSRARRTSSDRFRGDARGREVSCSPTSTGARFESLDAGSWFYEETGRGAVGGRLRYARSGSENNPRAVSDPVDLFRVPTLVDALALTADLDWLVNVEIKSFPESPPGLIEAVLDAIARTGTASRVLLSSFDHRELARIPTTCRPADHDLLAIPRGVLAWTPLFGPRSTSPPSWEPRPITPRQARWAPSRSLTAQSILGATLRTEGLAELKAAGIPILVYTVNDVTAGRSGPASGRTRRRRPVHGRSRGMRDLFG